MRHAILFSTIVTAMAASAACGSSPTPPTTPTTTTPTPANIAGSYDLTLAALQTCAQNLPAPTRMLKYIATITQTGTLNNLIIMTLTGDVAFGEVIISGVVSDKEFKITQFVYSEKTTGGGIALIATGSAAIAVDGSMTGTLTGTFQTPAAATCTSTVHGIQLTKR